MITNPNTLGLFDDQIADITELLHEQGALVYLDGANMNAILGVTRPGDFGVDMMHYNVHKTFTGPHGAGGPGAGPIAVREQLAPFLPAPLVVKDGDQLSPRLRPAQVDRPGAQLLRQRRHPAARLLLHPHARARTACARSARMPCSTPTTCSAGSRAPTRCRTATAACTSSSPAPRRCGARRKISAMDIAKRLLDFGYHAPTVYFPLVVPEAMMIEPTETESKETLDAFADALIRIRDEDADFLHDAPHELALSRPDEVKAAKEPVLRWKARRNNQERGRENEELSAGFVFLPRSSL